MSRLLDFLINFIKWPTAFIMFLSLPALIKAIDYISMANLRFFSFLGGMGAYLSLKILAAARSNVSMQILAHELTHTFFALLTFHKVVHIHLNMDDSGGSMGFRGHGNWLITIAPYFFPLFLFFIILGITYYSNRLPESYIINGILGYFFAYHLESIIIQIHGEQPDFKQVGFPFCWLFLPGANLLMCSIIVIFNNSGWLGIKQYMQTLYKLDLIYIKQILNYLTNL